MVHRKVTAFALAFAMGAGVATAQGGGAAPPPNLADLAPKAGDVAPDFTLPGSTKDGLLAKPVTLSDLKGQVVVLAFYPKARTSG